MSADTNGWVVPELKPCDARGAEMVELINSIEEGREHISSGQVGRNCLEIIMAVFESARSRRLVNFPLEIQENPLESIMKGE